MIKLSNIYIAVLAASHMVANQAQTIEEPSSTSVNLVMLSQLKKDSLPQPKSVCDKLERALCMMEGGNWAQCSAAAGCDPHEN
ncbi:MAG TPA: hypothetical protein PKC48_04370 [Sphingorhabdus sp.]|jgi:hypothetical protein|uniref:hypothetical protein n=1 Tax=Sphingorhabdus sp. TaxID=1902408 RepID=UPI002B54C4F6|nr:hypothetical protein [Sphingorhabdus sp.]HMT40990.1 hypothetical protein [Sphingorhabdus sp.]HMU21497.1 hypothetical protein [Sphingorhabdus sp.]